MGGSTLHGFGFGGEVATAGQVRAVRIHTAAFAPPAATVVPTATAQPWTPTTPVILPDPGTTWRVQWIPSVEVHAAGIVVPAFRSSPTTTSEPPRLTTYRAS